MLVVLLFTGYVGHLLQRTVALGEDGDKTLRLTMPDLEKKDTLSSRCQKPVKADAIQEHLTRGRFASNNQN